MGRIRRVIVLIWLFSLAVCIPSIFSKKIREFDFGEGAQWSTCNDAWTPEVVLGYNIYLIIILFGVPTIVIGVCYVLVVCTLYSSRRITKNMRPMSLVSIPMERLPGSDGDTSTAEGSSLMSWSAEEGKARPPKTTAGGKSQQKSETDQIKRIIVMLIVVVTAFLLCWGPLFTYSLLLRLGLLTDDNYSDYVWTASIILHLIAYGNSCINPFIYAFMSQSFRDGFVSSCSGCLAGRNQRGGIRRANQSSVSSAGYNTRVVSVSSANACNTRVVSVSSANAYKV